VEVGYTLDVKWTPRVFVGGAYLGGEDNRDISFTDWLASLACPFWKGPKSSVSFVRLGSNWEYSRFLDNANADLSNVWLVRAGGSFMPTECVKINVSGSHFESLESYDVTWPNYFILGNRVAWFLPFSWVTEPSPNDLGWELDVSVVYNYTKDLSFEIGYSRFFTGPGLSTGNGSFISQNGLAFAGGMDGDDADYAYIETKIAF